jgi:hypothetical protein
MVSALANQLPLDFIKTLLKLGKNKMDIFPPLSWAILDPRLEHSGMTVCVIMLYAIPGEKREKGEDL